MTGRNSKPKKKGPISHPGRLEQFGDKLSNDTTLHDAEHRGQSENEPK